MFDLVRKSKKEDGSQTPPKTPPDGSQIRVLAITQDARDWNTLHQIAEQCGWMLLWAHSCDMAANILSHYPIPIVIFDRDLPGEDWKPAMARISGCHPAVCILLASQVSDEYLWREVVQHQGFDVLPKPFQTERVIRMVNLASSWRGWMHGNRLER
jgi:DNA-binding NtrC family response regulator